MPSIFRKQPMACGSTECAAMALGDFGTIWPDPAAEVLATCEGFRSLWETET